MRGTLVKRLSSVCFWAVWPLAFVLLKGSRRVRIVVIQNDSLLCIYSYFRPLRWQLPGGGIKRGETVKEAALRELREETRIRIPKTELLVGEEIAIREFGISYIMHPCIVILSRELPALKLPLQTADARWVPITDIAKEKKYFSESVLRASIEVHNIAKE